MISFRFLLVSLVAVFLALGLGVLTGTTVINESLVARLEDQTAALERQLDETRSTVDRLSAESDTWAAFGNALMPDLVEGRLVGTNVVVVTQQGTDSEAVDRVAAGLERAEARVVALLEVTGRMALATEEDRATLAQALRLDGSADPEELEAQAADRLAERLAFGPETTDALADLIDAGFVQSGGPALDEEGLGALEDANAFVVVGGGAVGATLDPAAFLVPLVRDLVERGSNVSAVEAFDSAAPFVTEIRADGALDGRVVTQDNVDQLPGEIGFVMGLRDLVAEGRAGDYGVKDGADDVIPPA